MTYEVQITKTSISTTTICIEAKDLNTAKEEAMTRAAYEKYEDLGEVFDINTIDEIVPSSIHE